MNYLYFKSFRKRMVIKLSEELLNQNYAFRYQKNLFHFTSINLFNLHSNYYEILRVPRTATQKEIKNSYLKLCKLYHPDTKDSNLSEEDKVKRFQKINEAYSCLSKPELKLQYDQNNFQQSNINPNTNPFRHRAAVRSYPKR